MPLPLVPLQLLEPVRRVIEQVAVESQLRARRNALIACTALAQRRAERIEVEEFLAARAAPPQVESAAVEAGGRTKTS
jgi:hypothetical protein